MLVQVNTGKRVEGTADIAAQIEDRLRSRLTRFADRLTRAEVHVRDVDGHRNGGRGIEASVELRPAGGQPLATTDSGADTDTAVSGALRKAVDLLDRRFAKQDKVR
jgi:ribosome-associated translation inhibitor RaiA